MSGASTFQNRYHINFKGRRTTVVLDKILSELLAFRFGTSPDHPDYHSTMQQWLQATLRDKLGDNVPGGNNISQYARVFAIETIAQPELLEQLWDRRLRAG